MLTNQTLILYVQLASDAQQTQKGPRRNLQSRLRSTDLDHLQRTQRILMARHLWRFQQIVIPPATPLISHRKQYPLRRLCRNWHPGRQDPLLQELVSNLIHNHINHCLPHHQRMATFRNQNLHNRSRYRKQQIVLYPMAVLQHLNNPSQDLRAHTPSLRHIHRVRQICLHQVTTMLTHLLTARISMAREIKCHIRPVHLPRCKTHLLHCTQQTHMAQTNDETR